MHERAEDRIAGLAARQRGLVTRAQLLRAGVSPHAVDRRVKTGRLRPVHRGVYLVGPLVVRHARELAAVLACGPHAALSHRSAAALWQLLPDRPETEPVDVTLRRGDRGNRPGIRVHRVFSMGPRDVTKLDGIAVTTPARTLLDLAGLLDGRELERVLALAERRDLVSRRQLHSLLARRSGRRGARPLRELLGRGARPAFTRSEAEDRFLALIRRARLPSPEANVRIGDCEVDFLWREPRLVVEVDGFAFHASERQFESDRRRDARLLAAGFHVMRVTWRQLVDEPEALLVRVTQVLERLSPPGWRPLEGAAPAGRRRGGA
jgi:very-short-patch-repair endonuclease